MFVSTILALLTVLSTLTVQVHAHASCNPNVAMPNSYFATSIRIGHGCDGSPVNNVTVFIPEGVVSVRPRFLPGWTINFLERPLATPIVNGNTTVTTETYAISWSGNVLDVKYYEDFSISMRLPDRPDNTPIYFRVIQTCVQGEIDWAQIPTEGAAAEPEFPAARLLLRTNGTMVNDPDFSGNSNSDLKNGAAAAGLGSSVTLVGVIASWVLIGLVF